MSEKENPVTNRVRPGRNGGTLRIGGTNKGGPGRTPDEFKQKLRELVSADAVLAYLGECLRGDHGPKAAVSAMSFAAERGYGKVPASLDVTTGGEKIVVRMDLSRTNGNGNGDHAD